MNEFIEIRGARENNLKDVSLRVPKRTITIFTGVSGSGKSPIVFDTIATEAQRQLYENFSLFIRTFLPRYPRPEADAIENLSMAVVVDQKRLGGGSHSTVGTITDIYTVPRLLYSRVGQPYVGYSNAFSFNDPQGMCPECNGLGKKLGVVSGDFLDLSKSLNEGAAQVPFFATWESASSASSGFFDNDKKLADFTPDEMDLLLYSPPKKYKPRVGDGSMNATYMGIVEKVERAYVRRDLKTLSERTIDGRNIAELSAMEIGELIPIVRAIEDPVALPVVASLVERLQHVADIGLEYLSLNRETDTLSGGESQRIKMVKHLGSSLVDVTYIFDEPSVGLHPRDVHRLNELLQKLRDKGNTVLVVEHDPDVIRVADHVVDVGPHAGSAGGQIVFEGSYADLLEADTLTGRHLQQALPLKENVRKAFAAANNVDAGLFSFNSKGACENCKGSGVIYTDLAFLDGVKTPCEICQGRRFKDEVLAYTLNDTSIIPNPLEDAAYSTKPWLWGTRLLECSIAARLAVSPNMRHGRPDLVLATCWR